MRETNIESERRARRTNTQRCRPTSFQVCRSRILWLCVCVCVCGVCVCARTALAAGTSEAGGAAADERAPGCEPDADAAGAAVLTGSRRARV